MEGNIDSMNENDFFQYLLNETSKAFEKSKIKQVQKIRNKEWNFSVCSTPIQRGKTVVLGLNWGGGNSTNYPRQTKYPIESDDQDWNFVNNSKTYFNDYLKIRSINDVNYSNLCFFRSPDIKYLKFEDWDLSLPLMEDYVKYIKPQKVILIGTTGIEILETKGKLKTEKPPICIGERRKAYSYKGKLFDNYSFYCVPHPQARISTKTRRELWQKLFESNQNQ